MQIGFVGLGKMGLNMVKRLLRHDHAVIVYNRSSESIQTAVVDGAVAAESLEHLVRQLKIPRVIWLMLPAGQPTEENLQRLLPHLEKDDIVIDGGNAFYKDSMRRAKLFHSKNVHYLDVGVSGGIWGLEKGYCLMGGGHQQAFDHIAPLLKTLAPKEGFAYVGQSGAGHFAKMIHNGIEYAMLQAYGEGFEILNAKKEFNFDFKQLAHLWNQGSVIRSWLLTLAESAFNDDETLESIQGYVDDSGEGRWAVQEAIDLSVPAPTITDSLQARFRSRQQVSFSSKLIASLRHKFGGHEVK